MFGLGIVLADQGCQDFEESGLAYLSSDLSCFHLTVLSNFTQITGIITMISIEMAVSLKSIRAY